MVFSLLLTVFGIGALCALLYKAVVYALPVTVGIEAGVWAMKAGAGSVGGIVAGLVAGVMTFLLGQTVLGTTRSDILRFAVVLAFVISAAIAGYSAALDILALGMSSALWRHVLAVGAAAIAGGSAFVRLTTPIGEPRQPAGFGGAR